MNYAYLAGTIILVLISLACLAFLLGGNGTGKWF
jgi:cbb3-type cytochrome oxidase subunit 3